MKMRKVFIHGLLTCLLAISVSVPSVALAGEMESIFEFRVINTRRISGMFETAEDKEIKVDWGDGTSDKFSGRRQSYARDYGEDVDKTVKIYADSERTLRTLTMSERGANILFDLKDLPSGLDSLNVHSGADITGDLADLPRGLTRFVSYGSNVITGDIKDLPETLERFSCYGDNTITGDIRDLPETLESFSCYGNNTITGDIANLPPGLTSAAFVGDNTVYGDIGALPETLTSLRCSGANTVTGDIAELPRGLTLFSCVGDNTVYGDVSALPEGLTYLDCRGSNIISDYSSKRIWADEMRQVRLEPASGYGLSTAEVDNLIMDLSETTWAAGRKRLWLRGNNSPRSSASDSAVEALREMDVSVSAEFTAEAPRIITAPEKVRTLELP